MGAPVYARNFTSKIAIRKLEENGQTGQIVNVVSSWPDTTKVGPFEVAYLPVSHSIPESSALVIDTPKGRLIHSGDFKLDEKPVVGEPFDHQMWKNVCSKVCVLSYAIVQMCFLKMKADQNLKSR